MASPRKGRGYPYTPEEDEKIIQYVQKYGKNPKYWSILGNKFWMDMAENKITKHTWQGMKSHFLNVLAPRLETDFVAHHPEEAENEEEQASQEPKNSLVINELRRTIEGLSTTYGVATEVVFHALIAHSGDVKQAALYLKNNGVSSHTWSHNEDQILLGNGTNEDMVLLVEQRGKDAVQKRMDWLDSK